MIKEANSEWDRVAKYTTPQLKAIENTFGDTLDIKIENDESDRLDTAKRVAFLLQIALNAKAEKEGEISRS